MPSIRVKDNEEFEVALRRFKRVCEKSGILAEVRKRSAYEKPTEIRKRKAAAAVKRYRKKLEKERLQGKELRDRRKNARNNQKAKPAFGARRPEKRSYD